MSEFEQLPGQLKEGLRAMQEHIPDPNPVRQAAARQAFLRQARQLRAQHPAARPQPGGFSRQLTALFTRKETKTMPLAAKIMLIVALVAGATTGTAAAANASAPGQVLYPVDMVMEQVQYHLAGSPQAQARLNISLAQERGKEILDLAAKGDVIQTATQQRLQTQLQAALKAAAELDDESMIPALTKLQARLQEQARLLEMLGYAEQAQVMTRAATQAQVGVDDPAGFRYQQRNGEGWVVEEPVDNGDVVEEEAVDEPVGEEEEDTQPAPVQNQEQTRQQEQTQQQTQQQGCDPETEDCDALQQQEQIRQQTQQGQCDPEVEDCQEVPPGDQTQQQDQTRQQNQEQIQQQDQSQSTPPANGNDGGNKGNDNKKNKKGGGN